MDQDIIDSKKEVFTEIITPLLRKDSNFSDFKNGIHIGKQRKRNKILNKKTNFPKKKTLTRRDKAKLGLYTIPRNQIKYEDVVPLNHLWKQYMSQHLGLKVLFKNFPTVDQPSFNNLSLLLLKADYHGAIITVVRSKCPSLVGLEGIVIMDTKMTFKIVGKDNKTRTIPKDHSVFIMKLKSLEFTIFGKHISIRPAERSVKKIKSIMDPDLY